jgi:hypothetical protein
MEDGPPGGTLTRRGSSIRPPEARRSPEAAREGREEADRPTGSQPPCSCPNARRARTQDCTAERSRSPTARADCGGRRFREDRVRPTVFGASVAAVVVVSRAVVARGVVFPPPPTWPLLWRWASSSSSFVIRTVLSVPAFASWRRPSIPSPLCGQGNKKQYTAAKAAATAAAGRGWRAHGWWGGVRSLKRRPARALGGVSLANTAVRHMSGYKGCWGWAVRCGAAREGV